jgi:hypothetical protein
MKCTLRVVVSTVSLARTVTSESYAFPFFVVVVVLVADLHCGE